MRVGYEQSDEVTWRLDQNDSPPCAGDHVEIYGGSGQARKLSDDGGGKRLLQ